MPFPDNHMNAEIDPEGARRRMLEEIVASADEQRRVYIEGLGGIDALSPEQQAILDEHTRQTVLARAHLWDEFPPEFANPAESTDRGGVPEATGTETTPVTEPEASLTLQAIREWRSKQPPSTAKRR